MSSEPAAANGANHPPRLRPIAPIFSAMISGRSARNRTAARASDAVL
jgi:hypothetical protein